MPISANMCTFLSTPSSSSSSFAFFYVYFDRTPSKAKIEFNKMKGPTTESQKKKRPGKKVKWNIGSARSCSCFAWKWPCYDRMCVFFSFYALFCCCETKILWVMSHVIYLSAKRAKDAEGEWERQRERAKVRKIGRERGRERDGKGIGRWIRGNKSKKRTHAHQQRGNLCK